MRTAFGRRDRVTIRMHLRVAAIPGDRPFQRAMAAGLFRFAGKDLARDGEFLAERGREIVLQTAGEMEDRLFRDVAAFRTIPGSQDQRISTPPKR